MRVVYDGSTDLIPARGNIFYQFNARAARGTVSRTDTRFYLAIDWINDSDTVISTTTGSLVNLTTANTWYVAQASAVSPAGTVRVELRIQYERSGGGSFTVGDLMWVDALCFNLDIPSNTNYFDGDTPWTVDEGYLWTGGVGSSPTMKVENNVDDVATAFLARYSSTSMRVSRIRWNAQEDLASVSALTVGKTISLIYKGTTTTYRIVGIDGNIDAERYMIDYYLVKV